MYKKVICVKVNDKLKINKKYYATKHHYYFDKKLLDIYDTDNNYVGRFKNYFFKTLKELRNEKLDKIL